METLAVRVRPYVNELENIVRAHDLPYEMSPSGRLVRFAVEDQAVYVVRDAWGDGWSVMVAGPEATKEVRHHLEVKGAIAQAVAIVREIRIGGGGEMPRCA